MTCATPGTACRTSRLLGGALLLAGVADGPDGAVAVRLDTPVTDPDARERLKQRLTVDSEPEVRGAWRWMHDKELHWRPTGFWPIGTQVSVEADLDRLPLPDALWGSGVRTAAFEIGEAVISTVDVAALTMTVTRNGEVLRVLPASMGTPANPTRGGTHLGAGEAREQGAGQPPSACQPVRCRCAVVLRAGPARRRRAGRGSRRSAQTRRPGRGRLN